MGRLESPQSDAQSLASQVDVEKLRLVYATAPYPIVALMVGAVIVAAVLHFSGEASWIQWWFGLHVVFSAVRLQLLRVFRRRARLPQQFRFWALAYTATLAMTSALWGYLALRFDPSWSVDSQIIVLTFLIGICAAGGLTHAFYLPAYMGLLFPILLPLLWRMLSIPQSTYVLLGAGAVVFTVYMAVLSRRYSVTTGQFLELRFRNQVLVEDLSQVNLDLQREVSEHTRALEALAGRSRVLEMLARGDSLNQVLELLIVSMEQVLPGARGLILRLDEDGRRLHFLAGPNLNPQFVQAVDNVEADERIGTCGSAAVRRQRVVVDELERHPGGEPAVHLLTEQGFISSWSEPILSANGAVLGTLTVYHRMPRSGDRFESDFIQTTAQLAGIAIERKNTEAVLEQSRRHLEERVEARTRELRLVVREVESFNYSVSHDLRGPLRAIDGYSQILIEDYAPDMPEQARDYLVRCRSASQRMGQLIDGLLKISRMSRKDLERTWVNFSNVCDRIVDQLNAAAPERTVEWRVQRGITLWGDATLLEAVAENLLNNAWKFTANEAVARIEVGAAEANGNIKVWVRDNGAGFDMAYADKLFNPFQRLHDDRQFKGTGIGLATVERILKRHDGRIWAKSEPDKGATFSFSLPLVEEASPQYALLNETNG